jgi:hypothetical protein
LLSLLNKVGLESFKESQFVFKSLIEDADGYVSRIYQVGNSSFLIAFFGKDLNSRLDKPISFFLAALLERRVRCRLLFCRILSRRMLNRSILNLSGRIGLNCCHVHLSPGGIEINIWSLDWSS